jgi:hypothetical protein
MELSMTSDSSKSKLLRMRKPNIVLSDEQWLSVIEALENEDIIKAKKILYKAKGTSNKEEISRISEVFYQMKCYDKTFNKAYLIKATKFIYEFLGQRSSNQITN